MTDSWHSYPKVYNVGHRAVMDIFSDPVVIEEKVDGSQLSFGTFDGELRMRSRGNNFSPYAPEKIFAGATDTVVGLWKDGKLHDGWTYRGEVLQSPRHNALAYSRVPEGHVILFDVNTGFEEYLPLAHKHEEAARLGLECVPRLWAGLVQVPAILVGLLDRESVLGGVKIEGIVMKNYIRYAADGHALMAKHVSEAFKEVHKQKWSDDNPSQRDIGYRVAQTYRAERRWEKAVEHLRDEGQLEGEPKDIGALVRTVQADILAECEDEIKDKLFAFYKNQIVRTAVAGLPEWYKARLLEGAFKNEH